MSGHHRTIPRSVIDTAWRPAPDGIEWGLKLITPPNEEPISLAETRLHLRVDTCDDDTLILGLITAVRLSIEQATRRVFVSQTWDLQLSDTPNNDTPIFLPFPPLGSVISITFTDVIGVPQVWAASNYIVDATVGGPVPHHGSVRPIYQGFWPVVRGGTPTALVVRFVAGFGEAKDIPQTLKQAMLMFVTQLYERRSMLSSTPVEKLPGIVELLVSPWKTWL